MQLWQRLTPHKHESSRSFGKDQQVTRVIVLPQTTDGPAKTRERCCSLTAPFSCTMAPMAEEPLAHRLKQRVQERQEKDRSQSHDQEQFDPMVPFPEAWAFSASFTFGGTKRQFDLPAPCLSKAHPPPFLQGGDCCLGDQIPWFFSATGTSNHHPSRCCIARMAEGEHLDPHQSSALEPGIRDLTAFLWSLATDALPDLPFLSCCIP